MASTNRHHRLRGGKERQHRLRGGKAPGKSPKRNDIAFAADHDIALAADDNIAVEAVNDDAFGLGANGESCCKGDTGMTLPQKRLSQAADTAGS